MNAALTSSQRLRQLEQILLTSKMPSVAAADERDPATRHLESASLERIRQMSALIERSDGLDEDVDAVAMRLLLNDYTTAVAHLRAVTREASKRLDSAAEPVNDLRRFLWRDGKLRESLRETIDVREAEE